MHPPPPSDPPPPWLLLPKKYGPIGQVGVDVPDARDILALCDLTAQCAHLTYQLGGRQFHVKYGLSITWNEVFAQVTAASGLRSIFAQARAPTVYHAFQVDQVIIIVMDYVEGDTIMDLCEKSDDREKGLLAIEAGSALVELARVPLEVEGTLRPAGVDGGRLSHAFFGDQGATRHYRNCSELEDHINLMLSKRNSEILTGLSDERLVLCQGDPHLSNFIKDRSGRLWLIDFAHVDIVPITFVSCILHSHRWGPKFYSETFDGFGFSSNVKAVHAAAKWVVISSGVWSELGRRALRGDKANQDDIERMKTPQVMI